MKTLPKVKLAILNASTGNLPRGGKRPWSIIEGYPESAVKCADGRTLLITSPGIASMIVTAVNGFPKSCADIAAMQVCLKDLRTELRALPRTPVVAKLLAIVDVALCESDELAEMEPL